MQNQNKTAYTGFLKETVDHGIKLAKLERLEVVDLGQGFGVELSYGNWSGPIGTLIRGKVDIFAIAYPATTKLSPFVSFTNVLLMQRVGVLSSERVTLPEPHSSNLLDCIGVKSLTLVICSWLLVSTAFFLLRVRENESAVKTQRNLTFSKTLLSFYGLFFYKGVAETTAKTICRFLFASWLITVMIFGTAIGAELSAHLCVVKEPQHIETLEDILKYPYLQVAMVDTDPLENYLAEGCSRSSRELRRRLLVHSGLVNVLQLFSSRVMKNTVDGNTVLISHADTALKIVSSFYCFIFGKNLHLGKDDATTLPMVALYRKHLDSQVVEKINHGILQYQELGFLSKVLSLYTRRCEPCLGQRIPRSLRKPLTLKQTWMTFRAYLYGIIVAHFVLLLERVIKIFEK